MGCLARFRDRAGPAAIATLALSLAAGCGKQGRPLPPLPRGPLPPRHVAARQLGARAVVAFNVPEAPAGEPAEQAVVAELVRVAYPPGLEATRDADAFRRRGVVVARTESVTPGKRQPIADEHLGELEDGYPGWTVRYAVRLADRRGRTSPLAAAPDLALLTSVPPPSDLSAEPTADGIRLQWSAAPEGTPQRYNLYRATGGEPFPERPINSEPVEASTWLDAAPEGARYRYEVRVVLAPGTPWRESAGSPVIEVVAEDLFAPTAPQGLVAVQEGSLVRLFWNPGPERDLAGYRVSRRTLDEGDWQSVGPSLIEQPSWVDSAVAAGDRLAYRVQAVDRAGNESEPSAGVEIALVAEPMTPEAEP